MILDELTTNIASLMTSLRGVGTRSPSPLEENSDCSSDDRDIDTAEREIKAKRNSADEGYIHMNTVLKKRERSAREKHDTLKAEVKKMINQEIMANKYIQRVDKLKIKMKE